ncbi:hypothetical protein NVP1189B_40 [Vibrio phage 1.189.B._10N.286.51.B5]|nr:hypothetical protein NVP1189B_40 [Vibrio phage 1.189.B._10N.286.51.B5]AUR93932.1 hypothetical protein NVP1189C_40 [Vibrio phage 1.189.C._10N.286.51.B5]AUR93998.1 hypothetical protein NVP1189O_40 [Vibrio phage 1.189.O._10N.286.51.B5]
MATNTNTVFIDWVYKNRTFDAMTENGCIDFSESIEELNNSLIAKGYERVGTLEWRLKDEQDKTNQI